jgi:hypothetical protein
MLTRESILEKAYHDCMKEMYAKAQPSVDYDQLLEDIKIGKINKNERIYERYYLSKEEFDYILDKYIKAYNIKETWISNIEVLEDYLKNGGTKDKYIEPHTDEYGYHPGYRGYENVKPIFDQISNMLNTQGIDNSIIEFGITEAIFNTIKACKEFYKFDREQSSFSCSIALGPSPTTNPETVKEYWKSQGVDIDIEIRNPLCFWEQDYYNDEFEWVMEDIYGPDWKNILDRRWKEEEIKKEKEKNLKYQDYEIQLNKLS